MRSSLGRGHSVVADTASRISASTYSTYATYESFGNGLEQDQHTLRVASSATMSQIVSYSKHIEGTSLRTDVDGREATCKTFEWKMGWATYSGEVEARTRYGW
jgi:hypothetical protein